MAPKTSVAQRCSARSATLSTPKGCFAVFPGPLFHQYPAFFDAHDEAQVKYEMLRAHHIEGESVTAVAHRFGFSRQTFYATDTAFQGPVGGGWPPLSRVPRGRSKSRRTVQIRYLASVDRACSRGNSPATGRPETGTTPSSWRRLWTGPLCRHQLPAGQLNSDGTPRSAGKTDRYHQHANPIKTIWVYPLQRQYRALLTAPLETD